MAKLVDVSGLKFGRLTVVAFAGRRLSGKLKRRYWLCVCDCGTQLEVSYSSLATAHTRSCGCYRVEVSPKNSKRHGMTKTSEYMTWRGIVQRCDNPNSPNFKHYGARGIEVCERWKNFEHFLEDMGLRPSPEHSIERIDNDGPYSPTNCKWGTDSEQANNTRQNVRITFNGRTLTIAQWAVELKLPHTMLRQRVDSGWPVERVFSQPARITKRTRSLL